MNPIEAARALGKAIQADEKYLTYLKAKEANDRDNELQAMIGEFNMLRVQLNQEMSKSDKDNNKITELNEKIKSLYGKIMANKSMMDYNNAKDAMDELLNQINTIITFSANGEDPETCPATVEHSCSGSCSTCGGCH